MNTLIFDNHIFMSCFHQTGEWGSAISSFSCICDSIIIVIIIFIKSLCFMVMLNVFIQAMIMKQRSVFLFQHPQEGSSPCEGYSRIYEFINTIAARILATKANPGSKGVINSFVVG